MSALLEKQLGVGQEGARGLERDELLATDQMGGLNEELKEALSDASDIATADGWVVMANLVPILRRRRPEWDVRNYGISKTQGFSGLMQLPSVQAHFEVMTSPDNKCVPMVRERRGKSKRGSDGADMTI